MIFSTLQWAFAMGNTLAIMVTATTYGKWLRGDKRGSRVRCFLRLPPLGGEGWGGGLKLGTRTNHPSLTVPLKGRGPEEANGDWQSGQMIGDSLIERKRVAILALHVARWHMHLVVAATNHDLADVVKCAKDAARYGLQPGRPIWTADYDKRFCFDDASVRNRIAYVERHNLAMGWPARPWRFIADSNFNPSFSPRSLTGG